MDLGSIVDAALRDGGLAAFDAAVERAEIHLEMLLAFREVVAARAGKSFPPPLPPDPAKRRNAGASKNWHKEARNGKGRLLSDEYRAKMAESLAELGPCGPSELSDRTGIARNGVFSVTCLAKDHEWFELIDRVVHLTPAGHQAATGKGGEE